MYHTSNRTLSIMAALPLMISLSGCVFHDYNSPHIEGVILNQGQPVADVPVVLTDVDTQVRTTTDSQGRFTLAPPGEWHLFIPHRPTGQAVPLVRYNRARPENVYRVYGIPLR